MRKIFLMASSVFLLAACGNDNSMDAGRDNSEFKEEELTEGSERKVKTMDDEKESTKFKEEELDEESEEKTKGADGLLNHYSAEEIEYARVWLTINGDQELDYLEELTVGKSLPGEAVDSSIEGSAKYPEEVTHLTALSPTRSIVYSSNGDGSINLYHTPVRWKGHPEYDGKTIESLIKWTKEIVENPERVKIPKNDDRKVEKIIQKIKINKID